LGRAKKKKWQAHNNGDHVDDEDPKDGELCGLAEEAHPDAVNVHRAINTEGGAEDGVNHDGCPEANEGDEKAPGELDGPLGVHDDIESPEAKEGEDNEEKDSKNQLDPD